MCLVVDRIFPENFPAFTWNLFSFSLTQIHLLYIYIFLPFEVAPLFFCRGCLKPNNQSSIHCHLFRAHQAIAHLPTHVPLNEIESVLLTRTHANCRRTAACKYEAAALVSLFLPLQPDRATFTLNHALCPRRSIRSAGIDLAVQRRVADQESTLRSTMPSSLPLLFVLQQSCARSPSAPLMSW